METTGKTIIEDRFKVSSKVEHSCCWEVAIVDRHDDPLYPKIVVECSEEYAEEICKLLNDKFK